MRRQPFFFFYILPNSENYNKFANKFAYIKKYYYLCALFGVILTHKGCSLAHKSYIINSKIVN